jgi:hypothetical protein
VIAPAASDLEIAWRESLQPEARALDEGDRGGVFRLDIRLHSVQLQGDEGVPQDQLQTFGHVALMVERTLRVIPHVSALEEAADNLVQHEDADDRSVLDPADEEAFDPRFPQALHPFGEGDDIGRWCDPSTMDRATCLVPGNHLCFVAPCRFAQIDALAHLEGTSQIRLAHAEPSLAGPH